ncbi:MAG: hypothetical protein WCI11_07840 [Candidatus Methylumidiphilus sp.]
MANGGLEVVESLQERWRKAARGNLEEIAGHEEYDHCPQWAVSLPETPASGLIPAYRRCVSTTLPQGVNAI